MTDLDKYMERFKVYLPIESCKNNFLYIIDARNSTLGIYKQNDYAFTISRFKFKSNFLFDEYHYDIGAIKPDMECYGTVRPLKELYEIDEMDDVKKLKFLNDKLKELKEQIQEHFPDITANFDFVDGSWISKLHRP